MTYRVSHPSKILKGEITLTSSKSESNRALIIQALSDNNFAIENLAKAEDTRVLNEILGLIKNNTSKDIQTYDVGAAGTTMRFTTAFLSTQKGTHIITGSERMKNRPIGILVDALRELGAEIEYVEKEGYPPLKITGKTFEKNTVTIDGGISSQYITALLLIAPTLKNGLTIKFKGEVTSVPYIEMTLSMMRHFGITIEPKTFDANNGITITPQAYNTDAAFLVEGDWSSASYWYAFAACANEVDLTIHGLRKDSLQGDSALASFFKELGIETTFKGLSITLSKTNSVTTNFNYDFSDCPDLAQTVATTVSPLNIPSTFEGLHTLRIKETDRTAALKAELAKLGTAVELINNGDSIKITPDEINKTPKAIATYEDHRMAMAFAVYAMANDYIDIEEPEVVKKSYPDFWKDLKKMGFQIEEI